jgi:uncharacterized protein YjiK
MTFVISDSIDVGISEPSDVTALPGGRFFVVSDVEPSGMIVSRDAKRERVAIVRSDDESGFEAVAFDPDRKRLYVVAEERHVLLTFEWNGELRARSEQALPPIGFVDPSKHKKGKKKKSANKGVEGMAWLSAERSPIGTARLVMAKEARPCALVLFDPDDIHSSIEVALDPEIERACEDFSGLALDPTSGNLFLCSDESATVAELEVTGGTAPYARLIEVTELRDRSGDLLERVEGIAFDETGDLHVLLENECTLWRFTRQRRG